MRARFCCHLISSSVLHVHAECIVACLRLADMPRLDGHLTNHFNACQICMQPQHRGCSGLIALLTHVTNKQQYGGVY